MSSYPYTSFSQVWYRCAIIAARSDHNVWDVLYDDGEVRKNLCHRCVRPFIPYAINETIEVLITPEDYYTPCKVTSIHHSSTGDLLFDLQLEEPNKILQKVSTNYLRRNYRNVLTRIPIHSQVIVLLRDESNNYPNYEVGEVLYYDASQNSYTVIFGDGEILKNVPRRHIKLIK